ncbi:MAG: ribosomal RNA small subunit methyltransferase G [Armatimonadota bacterium]|nr:MAG: ribosomal RNA small subunit methyltransferase G [Armatimonadota bacterium]
MSSLPSGTTGTPQDFAEAFGPELRGALDALGLELAPETWDLLERFALLVLDANARMNLTSVTDPRGMAIKHFADSLSLLRLALPERASVVDVGTGGGFPGVPLAIVRPDLEVILLDATQKKTRFLNDACRELALDNCKAVTGRAETLAHEPAFRESFDVAVWRGLGDLRVSAELCLGMVKVSGMGVAMKGPRLDEELPPARPVIGQMGARVERTVEVCLPDDVRHRLLVMRKHAPTPHYLPRSWSKIRRTGKG